MPHQNIKIAFQYRQMLSFLQPSISAASKIAITPSPIYLKPELQLEFVPVC